ncbi:hypothetical protein R1flu_001882 [Riccia fluitans]|uniref:Uncharacterized protein n=1 Tax=Riccia fluitans TaxID=41844 RepID=A0ABD1Y7V8_9MARC
MAEMLLMLNAGPGSLRSFASDRALAFSGCLSGLTAAKGPGPGIGSNSNSGLTSRVVLWRISILWTTSRDREQENVSRSRNFGSRRGASHVLVPVLSNRSWLAFMMVRPYHSAIFASLRAMAYRHVGDSCVVSVNTLVRAGVAVLLLRLCSGRFIFHQAFVLSALLSVP